MWVSWLEHEGIGLQSLYEVIDTASPSGKLTFHIFAAPAEFERQLIQEWTQAGLRAARVRGRVGSRPKVLAPGKRQRAMQLYQAKQLTVKEICEMMGIPKPTLYPYVRQAQASSLSNDTEFRRWADNAESDKESLGATPQGGPGPPPRPDPSHASAPACVRTGRSTRVTCLPVARWAGQRGVWQS